MISKEVLKKIKKLEIQTKGLVNTLFGGEYQSAFKGRGMAFSEVRAYNYGDDIRQIDWNVTARTGEPYIKIFEEEREQTLMLCVDISASGIFGTHQQKKKEVAIEISAVLAFSAINNGDKVGLVLFSDKIEKVVPPKKGRTHVLRLIRELYTTTARGKGTNIADALSYVNRLLDRRAIVVLATDFQDTNYEKQLRITNQKHDLVSIIINDPFEEELPNIGLVPFLDSETNREILVDTSSSKIRDNYRKQRAVNQARLDESLLKMKVDAVRVSTNKSYVRPLMNFFKRRLSRY